MTSDSGARALCVCSGLQAGMQRVYDMPSGSTITFVMDTDLDYPWQSIQRCSVCGQYWRQDTISSHANIETWEKITVQERQALLTARDLI